jgi:hypothetical protein
MNKIDNWFNLNNSELAEIMQVYTSDYEPSINLLSSSKDNHGVIEQLKKDILDKLYLKKVAILVYTKLNGSTFIELK